MTDEQRLNWLDENNIEDVRGRMLNENVCARCAIDYFLNEQLMMGRIVGEYRCQRCPKP